MWWWIEPLFKTGVVCLFIGGIISVVFHEIESDILTCIAVILILPLGISVCASIIWFLTEIFKEIWIPYL